MGSEGISQSKQSWFTSKNVTYFAVLLALIIVLQLGAGVIAITPTTKLSFVLVPIVLGGMLLGPLPAMVLGIIFGLIVYFQGLFGVDAFTMILINEHGFSTFLIVVVKGGACGFVSGLAYKLLKNKNKIVAGFVASMLAPITNTGIFILGSLLVLDTIKTNFVADGTTVIYFLVITCAGVNFLIEFAINVVCAPAILRISQVIEKYIKK